MEPYIQVTLREIKIWISNSTTGEKYGWKASRRRQCRRRPELFWSCRQHDHTNARLSQLPTFPILRGVSTPQSEPVFILQRLVFFHSPGEDPRWEPQDFFFFFLVLPLIPFLQIVFRQPTGEVFSLKLKVVREIERNQLHTASSWHQA